MKKKLLLILALFYMVFLCVDSASAWYLEMDNAEEDNTVEVWFKVNEGETVNLRYYGLGFVFDATELAWINEYENNLPSNFNQKYSCTMQGVGVMTGFQGGGSRFTITEDYLLGSYTMKILDGTVKDGQADIYFPTEPLDDFNVYSLMIQTVEDGTLKSYQLSTGGHLANGSGLDFGAAVPVPGSLLLLGIGSMGLLGFRHKASS